MDDEVDLLANTTTTNYGWTKPEVGSDLDAWGDHLNLDLDQIDSKVHEIDVRPPSSLPSDAMPTMNGTGDPGVGTTWSRSDHKHPTDTSRFSTAGGSLTGGLNVGGNISIQSTAPTLSFRASGAQPVDQKNWDLYENTTNGDLAFRSLNDAYSAATYALTFNRNTGYVAPTITFGVSATFSNGLKFTNAIQTDPLVLAKHLDVYGGQYGFSITGGTMNIIAAAAQIAAIQGSGISIVGGRNLTLSVDPTANMHAATKQYVDGKAAGVIVSDTAPISPKQGDLWFDSVGSQLYCRYNDGTSSQWVGV